MPPYELLEFETPDALAQAAATALLADLQAASQSGRTFSVALSGGRVARLFFERLAEQARAHVGVFDHVHFFWADERCVPPDSADSNYRLAQEGLFAPLNLPASNIHRLRGELEPAQAVVQAEAELRELVAPDAKGMPALDLVLLGLGEDGHVASLFPGAGPDVVNCPAPFLAIYDSPKPPPRRITLSYAAIAAARAVWVLASGAGKAEALRNSLIPGGQTPLARVIQQKMAIKILCDPTKEFACKQIA
jgi:6-phosphogluconolactonase